MDGNAGRAVNCEWLGDICLDEWLNVRRVNEEEVNDTVCTEYLFAEDCDETAMSEVREMQQIARVSLFYTE